MNKVVCFLKILSFFAVIKFGESSPKCYICDSKTNPDCMDPVKNNMKTEECLPTRLADAKQIVENIGLNDLLSYLEVEINKNDMHAPLNCLKTVAKVNDKEIIVRGCQLAIKDDLNICKKLIDEKKDIIEHCSLCENDGCNSAPAKTISALFMILIVPLFVLF